MKKYLYPTNICLPDFSRVDGQKWASVACDQFTSQPEYWAEAREFVGDMPSTLDLMLPEAYLDRKEELIPVINDHMKKYLSDVLVEHKDSMIYLERVQSDGRVRNGIIGAIDLEEYDYRRGATTCTRATEGTVLERIPPRVAIRRGAVIEMPHIMILIDDPDKTVIEPVAQKARQYKLAYDFDLMAGGGHATGYFIDKEDFDGINESLSALATPDAMMKKYGVDAPALLFAIGDGNHSLATAKSLYEEIKAEIGEEAAKAHPARYALCEIVNLHDEALDFEPIYRVIFGVEPEKFVDEFEEYLNSLEGTADEQSFEIVFGDECKKLIARTPTAQLAVGTAQNFIDEYLKTHPSATVDYIHGVEVTKNLAKKENAVGLLFDGMEKNMLFKTVICDGALPRKTFSMGHAEDKRYYIECRKIR